MRYGRIRDGQQLVLLLLHLQQHSVRYVINLKDDIYIIVNFAVDYFDL